MSLDYKESFEKTKIAGSIAAGALDEVSKIIKPGISTEQIDKMCYEYIIKELDKDSIKYIDSYTNFITIYFGKDASAIFEGLLKKGIILRPLNNYGLPNYLRVTIGTMNECKLFIKNLRILLKRTR